jgi:hypothetical protein
MSNYAGWIKKALLELADVYPCLYPCPVLITMANDYRICHYFMFLNLAQVLSNSDAGFSWFP